MTGRRFRSYGPEDTLVKTRMFSIHIPETSLARYPQDEWDRLLKFVEEHCSTDSEYDTYNDPIERKLVVTGTASSKVISTLMAIARGHDLTTILDEFEKAE